VDGYSGDAGNAMMESTQGGANSNGHQFGTVDRDYDNYGAGNCASMYNGGGWWYDSCTSSGLNNQGNAIWTTGASAYDVEASRMLVKCK